MDIAPYLDLIPTANIHEAVRPVEHSLLWSSVGGTERVEPFGLLYTVGRSRPL